MIKASELLKKIKAGDWQAEVENDEDCYPQLFNAVLEADADGSLSLTGYYGYCEDSARYGISLGQIVVEIDGVRFSTERLGEGDIDSWDVDGEDVEYDKGLTEGDLTAALEKGDLPHYDPDSYEFDESSVTADELKNVCCTYPKFLVETEDGDYLGFDDKDSVPEGATPVELEDVINQLFDIGDVSYDFRG